VTTRNRKPLVHVTAGIILDQGRVLIAKRQKGSHLEGLWEFPGGKQERGETLKECLEREFREELGIQVRADHQVLTVDHDYGDRLIFLHIFRCTLIAGDPKTLQCQECRWVDPVDFSKFTFAPPDTEAIRLLGSAGRGTLGKEKKRHVL
jgi:mutator protein MutT